MLVLFFVLYLLIGVVFFSILINLLEGNSYSSSVWLTVFLGMEILVWPLIVCLLLGSFILAFLGSLANRLSGRGY